MKKATLFVCLLLVGLSPSVIAQEAIDKRALIVRLMEQTGLSSQNIGDQLTTLITQQVSTAMRQSNPAMDPRAYTIVQEEVGAVVQEELVSNDRVTEMMFPLYDDNFTAEELKQMVAINDTPLGKKIIEITPQIAQENMRILQGSVQSLGPIIQQRIMSRFQKEGIGAP